MRKLVLLALLLSTPAYAADQGGCSKLAQYGQCILKYGGACPKAAVGFPIPLPPKEFCEAIYRIASGREDGRLFGAAVPLQQRKRRGL